MQAILQDRKINERIEENRTLDLLLVQSSYLSNLSDEEIRQLRKSNVSAEEIAIVDYISGYSKDKIVQKVCNARDRAEILSGLYFDVSPKEHGSEREFFTPLKSMARHAYSSFLKSNISRQMLPNASSKDDYKAVLFIDYLIGKLSEKRKKCVEEKKSDITASLNTAALLYVVQESIPKIKNENKVIADFADELERKKKIALKDLQQYREFDRNRPPYVHYEIDEEAGTLLEERKSLMEQAKTLVADKVAKKRKNLENECSTIREEFSELEAKISLQKDDAKRLEGSVSRLKLICGFYEEAQIEDEAIETTLQLREEIEKTLSEYNEFIKNRDSLQSQNRKIIYNKDDFNRLLARNKFGACEKLLLDVANISQSANMYSHNRYFEQTREEIKNLATDFYQTASTDIGNMAGTINKKISEIRSKKENSTSLFSKLILNPFRNAKLKELEKLLRDTDLLKEQVNALRETPLG